MKFNAAFILLISLFTFHRVFCDDLPRTKVLETHAVEYSTNISGMDDPTMRTKIIETVSVDSNSDINFVPVTSANTQSAPNPSPNPPPRKMESLKLPDSQAVKTDANTERTFTSYSRPGTLRDYELIPKRNSRNRVAKSENEGPKYSERSLENKHKIPQYGSVLSSKIMFKNSPEKPSDLKV